MNNVVAFRHLAASRAHEPAWPGPRRSKRTLPHEAMHRRQVLIAEWRVSATDGRLECRWRSEGGEQRDEEGSCRSGCRHAA